MKNKLDKSAKPSSGKSKDSISSDSKSKPKPGTSTGKRGAPAATAKKAKPEPESKPGKASSQARSAESKGKSTPTRSAGSARSTAVSGGTKPAKTSSPTQRETASSASKQPAAGKTGARSRPKATAADTASEFGLEELSISRIKPGETKERIWRTKNFEQYPAQREFGFPDMAPELPSNYSDPKLVLMPKDPEYMFCYWELTSSLLKEKEREKLPTGNYRETLKINWESRSLFEPNFTFIPVFFWARKWYFGVPQVGQRYQVELGWLSDSGHFISIIRSNLSELPESWAVTQKRLAEEGEVLAYSSRHTKTLGSSEHMVLEDTRAFAPEWNLSSESMSSSSWSRGVSQESVTAISDRTAAPVKGAKSRPAANKARLEVSGRVLPGTQVFVGGNPVSVDSTGVFRTEFPYNKDILKLELTSTKGNSRSFSYDLKELVLN